MKSKVVFSLEWWDRSEKVNLWFVPTHGSGFIAIIVYPSGWIRSTISISDGVAVKDLDLWSLTSPYPRKMSLVSSAESVWDGTFGSTVIDSNNQLVFLWRHSEGVGKRNMMMTPDNNRKRIYMCVQFMSNRWNTVCGKFVVGYCERSALLLLRRLSHILEKWSARIDDGNIT